MKKTDMVMDPMIESVIIYMVQLLHRLLFFFSFNVWMALLAWSIPNINWFCVLKHHRLSCCLLSQINWVHNHWEFIQIFGATLDGLDNGDWSTSVVDMTQLRYRFRMSRTWEIAPRTCWLSKIVSFYLFIYFFWAKGMKSKIATENENIIFKNLGFWFFLFFCLLLFVNITSVPVLFAYCPPSYTNDHVVDKHCFPVLSLRANLSLHSDSHN